MRGTKTLIAAAALVAMAVIAACSTQLGATEAPPPTEAPTEAPTREPATAVPTQNPMPLEAPIHTPVPTEMAQPTEVTQEDETATGEEFTVMVVDSNFRDKEISIAVGTTVVWVYDALLPHTVTSDDGFFNSGTLREGDTFRYTFTDAGSFRYYCQFHGGPNGRGMSGIVTVTEEG